MLARTVLSLSNDGKGHFGDNYVWTNLLVWTFSQSYGARPGDTRTTACIFFAHRFIHHHRLKRMCFALAVQWKINRLQCCESVLWHDIGMECIKSNRSKRPKTAPRTVYSHSPSEFLDLCASEWAKMNGCRGCGSCVSIVINTDSGLHHTYLAIIDGCCVMRNCVHLTKMHDQNRRCCWWSSQEHRQSLVCAK